jgi:hypothetical protein
MSVFLSGHLVSTVKASLAGGQSLKISDRLLLHLSEKQAPLRGMP